MISLRQKNQGFTLVELTLVMAAMSIMLLTIIYVTLQAGAIYSKGVTNRTINQLSREISDTMRRDFTTADPSEVQIVQSGSAPNVTGRICLGTVSYVWNSASMLNSGASGAIKRTDGTTLNLTRVDDPTSYYCTKSSSTGKYPVNLQPYAKQSSMLNGNGRSFAVYGATLDTFAINPPEGLFHIKMTVGTNDPNTTSGTGAAAQCRPPTDNSSDFTYCSVVDIDIVVRAGGKA